MTESAQTQSKIFISYSRKDTDFTRKLYAGLDRYDLITWVDWEGIPLTADWMAEIREAIESADTFVFIITPDSVRSEVCNQELQLALASNKRLVPVLHRELDSELMAGLNKELAATNWIYMRPEDDFAATLKDMVEAINTDLDYVKSHTRLLERALEWDRFKRDNSFTLRGSDLESAEGWLSDAGEERQPVPTHLHSEYILISRKEYANRQRRVLIGTAVALVVSVVLGLLAYGQWQRAEALTLLAVSRQLAAQSFIEKAPDLALLLSVESNQFADTEQGRTSLLAAVTENASLNKYLHGHDDEVHTVAYGHGGWLATAGVGNRVIVWDQVGGAATQFLQISPDPEAIVYTLAVNADSSVLAAGDSEGEVSLWDTATWTEIANYNLSDEQINRVAFSPDNELLAIATQEGVVLVLQAADGRVKARLMDHAGAVLGVAFSLGGDWLASSDARGGVIIWDAAGFDVKYHLEGHAGEATSVVFNLDGTRLFSAGQDRRIHEWDVSTGDLISQQTGHTGKILSLTLSPDGGMLVSGAEDQSVINWTLENGSPQFLNSFAGHTNFVRGLAFSPDGAYLASVSYRTVIICHSLYPGFGELHGHDITVRQVVFSPDGSRFASGDESGHIVVWDAQTGEQLLLIEDGGTVFALDYSGDGKLLVSGNFNGAVSVWDAETGEKLDEYVWVQAMPVGLVSLSVNYDGSQVAATGFSTEVLLWDRESDQGHILEGHTQHQENFVRWVDFSPYGSQLLTGDWFGEVILWDVASLSIVYRLDAFKDADSMDHVLHVAFSPSGFEFSTTSDNGTVRIWRTDTGVNLNNLSGHVDWVHGQSFGHEGQILATASEDNTIILWDWASGAQIASLSAHDGAIISVAFSPNENVLVSAGSDGKIVVWDVDLDSLAAKACERANRNFTREEWLRYIGEARSFAPTCDFPGN